MLSIKYDPAQDLRNWLRIKYKYPNNFTLTQSYPFNREIILAENNFDQIVNSISSEDVQKFNDQAIAIQQQWAKIEAEMIKKITNYLNLPLVKFNFRISLTTAYFMPYDYQDKWFMIPTHKPITEQIECIIHELFHLYQLKRNPPLVSQDLEDEVQKFLKSLR